MTLNSASTVRNTKLAMTLSIVIPVWNDEVRLTRLLRQVVSLGCFSEVIVVDDGSDEPMQERVSAADHALSQHVVWIRSGTQRGAGHARNLGLDRATGSHLIFFDADDLLTEQFPLIADGCAVETEPFDFLMFRHDDSRLLNEGLSGSFCSEEERWRSIDWRDATAELSLTQAAHLCQISAYPWNKIYRTEFLRRNAIRCTEIAVNNDLELHWSSFIVARRILVTNRIGATHFWHPGSNQLTNRFGRERLAVFVAFDNIVGRLVHQSDPNRIVFLHPFFSFGLRLIAWIWSHIDPVLRPELLSHTRDFLFAVLDRNLMTLIAYRDEALAQKINRILAGEFVS